MEVLREEKGFSLIETIVALVAFLILVAAFSGAFTIGLRTEGDMDNKIQVQNIADSVIEFLRGSRESLGENNIEFSNGNLKYDGNKEKIYNEDEINFINNTDITFNSVNSSEGLFEVEVKITWEDREDERSYSLNALLAGD